LWTLVLAALISDSNAQHRSSELHWTGQTLDAGKFNVHKIEVFSAAESLEVVVKAERIEHFDSVNIWLRHGTLPTPQEHHVHAVLHKGRGRKGTKDVGLHVKNPLQGDWYVAIAPWTGATVETPPMEVTDHQFVEMPGRVVYSVASTVSGCERGRFGFPSCSSNWMQLSWGKEARFHGELSAGKDVWTCSMYEVAPYTSNVAFTLVAPGKQHMKHATPQIYARYHAYPTLSEYDVTTAVNGNEWKPAVAVTLPKSGTWYVCVHAHRLVHKESLPVAVQVNAQVLPHNECVERTHVSLDGQHVEHTTSCQNEVEKLQVSCPAPGTSRGE